LIVLGKSNKEVFVKIPIKPKRKVITIDKTYEEMLKEYIDKNLEEERKKYHSDLEPFEIHAEKVRKELEDYFHNFYLSFHNGYKAIVEQLKKQKK
jgi:hypothetical protein